MNALPHLHRSRIRKPACAGSFYAASPDRLRREIQDCMAGVAATAGPLPIATIVPHAGYVYSGPVAASAYARLQVGRTRFRRVALMGPAHHVGIDGMAVSAAEAFATPLGEVSLDVDANKDLLSLPNVRISDEAHTPEHCLEVQLPFLQTVLEDFRIVPVLVGRATDEAVAEVIERLRDERTLIVISSDLSHYRSYAEAVELDKTTAGKIEALSGASLASEHACGARPIRGLLEVAKQRGWRCYRLDLRNSGDTAGPRDRVVGYGAFIFAE